VNYTDPSGLEILAHGRANAETALRWLRDEAGVRASYVQFGKGSAQTATFFVLVEAEDYARLQQFKEAGVHRDGTAFSSFDTSFYAAATSANAHVKIFANRGGGYRLGNYDIGRLRSPDFDQIAALYTATGWSAATLASVFEDYGEQVAAAEIVRQANRDRNIRHRDGAVFSFIRDAHNVARGINDGMSFGYFSEMQAKAFPEIARDYHTNDGLYLGGSIGGEFIQGYLTGGLARLRGAGTIAKVIGRTAFIADIGLNARDALKGIADIQANGLSYANALQTLGGAAGLGGNVLGVLGKARLLKGAPGGPSLRGDIALSGGRSGQNVKNLVGPPNSAVRGGGDRIFITNDKGQVILDITRDRVKSVTPGQGFGPKRPHTPDELSLLDQLLGGGL
jgi:hypothetical protein